MSLFTSRRSLFGRALKLLATNNFTQEKKMPSKPESHVSAVGSIEIQDDRVVQDAVNLYKVALLSDVDGVSVESSDAPRYWVAAAVFASVALLALLAGPSLTFYKSIVGLGGVLAFVFFIAYLSSRRTFVAVHAGSLRMRTFIHGRAFAESRHFATTVMNAKYRAENGPRVPSE